MNAVRIVGGLIVTIFVCSMAANAAEPALRPWEKNPWYWSYHGTPVLLLGGSDDDSLFQWPEEKLVAQLDRLAAAGGNLIRNTMSSRKDLGVEVFPFKQLREGMQDGRYDLEQWNDEYWIRFERMLRETAKRHIVVQIELWDPWDVTGAGGGRWHEHPYNPRNNINYTGKQSGLADRYTEPAYHNAQPFFFTTPEQRNNTRVLQYQQQFVNKMLDYALQYDHVLYCIDNETSAEEAWGRYWATFITRRAEQEKKKVFVTEMWDHHDITADVHHHTYDHPELYGFVEVSQNNHQRGQKHWDQILRVRQHLSPHPRPINSIKIYGADAHRFGSDLDAIERFWRHLLAGVAAVRFHRPDAGLGLGNKAVASIRAARKLESLVPLWTVEPANDLLGSSGFIRSLFGWDSASNHAYLAADRKRAFILFMPAGGEVDIDVSSADEPTVVRWIDIATGEWGPEQAVSGGAGLSLESPGSGPWAAAILPRNSGNLPAARPE